MIKQETLCISHKSLSTLQATSWIHDWQKFLTPWHYNELPHERNLYDLNHAHFYVVHPSFLSRQNSETRGYEKKLALSDTNTYNFIFASASLNLTIASSCLTVIGIAAASPVSFACCLMSYNEGRLSIYLNKTKLLLRQNFMAGGLSIQSSSFMCKSNLKNEIYLCSNIPVWF